MKKPNVVMILSDDHGAWAMHCAGNTDIHTPNLDRLKKIGTYFKNYFCASPVCSPARASLLTGTIPSAHGVHDWIVKGNLDTEQFPHMREHLHFQSLDKPIRYLEGQKTYTDMLAQNGYTCALSGKWHLGDSITPQHGFSKWFTIGTGGCGYFNADVVHKGEMTIETRYITEVITDQALEYLDELVAAQEPYYLSIHYTAPHGPWNRKNHPKAYFDRYEDCTFEATPDEPLNPRQINTAQCGEGKKRKEILKGYYASITAMDEQIGRVLSRLEVLGQLDNTIIIYTADNGMNMGHHGLWGKGNASYPMNMYDTSVKVPFIIAWPGQVAIQETAYMASHYDFFPTLMDLVGIEHRGEQLPGRSYKHILLGEQAVEDIPICIFDEYGPVRMIRTAEWKYVKRYGCGEDECYNLMDDPEEKTNLIEVLGGRQEVAKLGIAMQAWFDKYADETRDGQYQAVTGKGQIAYIGNESDGKVSYKKDWYYIQNKGE